LVKMLVMEGGFLHSFEIVLQFFQYRYISLTIKRRQVTGLDASWVGTAF